MGSLNKIKKNASIFAMGDTYGKMTPVQIDNAIQSALNKQKEEMINVFRKRYENMERQYNEHLTHTISHTFEMFTVEFVYELANQLEYWDKDDTDEDDKYFKDSAKYRIKEIVANSLKNVDKYNDMKNEKMANSKYDKRKKKIEKEFGIIFK